MAFQQPDSAIPPNVQALQFFLRQSVEAANRTDSPEKMKVLVEMANKGFDEMNAALVQLMGVIGLLPEEALAEVVETLGKNIAEARQKLN